MWLKTVFIASLLYANWQPRPQGSLLSCAGNRDPLARSNDIPVLNGFVNTIDSDQNQSDLSELTLGMRRVTGSP